MGDILPLKRQAVVDRLRRRIELYRRKQNGSLIRYEQTSNGWNHQQRQDTIFLKQRYLETKAKKTKKNDNKSTKDGLGTNSENTRNILSKPAKRPAESLDTPLNQSDGLGDPSEHQVKLACHGSSPSQGQQRETQGQSSLPHFSVQIVQQFSSSDSSHVQNSQTVQTNVSVKAVHPNSPMTSMASGQCNTLQEPQVSSATSIECKQEKEGSLNQCSSMGLGMCNNHNSTIGNNSSVGERFSDAFSTLGFPDDSSSDVIDPDILKDLIDDVLTTGNPSDLMKDFNFDDSSGSDREQNQEPKETVDPMLDITGKPHSTPPIHGHFSSTHSPFSTLQAQGGTSGFSPGPRGSPMGNHTSVSATPSTTYQSPHSSNYTHTGSFSVSPTLGLDFKLSEPSPAAQTLKQMAEQHQSLQQKQQIGLNMNSPHSRSPFTNENFTESMTLPSLRSGFMSTSSGQVNTAQKTQTSGMLASRSYDKQVNFTSVRPASGSGPFKQESENGAFPGSQGLTTTNNMGPVPGMDYQKQQQVIQIQHLHQLPPEQKSVMSGAQYGVPSPDNKQSQSGMPQPSAYGSTRPLSHFTAGQTSSLHNQFVRGPSPGIVSSPTQHYRPASRSNLQLSHTQQLQISQAGSQLQVCQNQQLQLSRDFKLNPTGSSQQISLFSSYPHSTTAPRTPFQMNMSQTQSVNFTNQFSGTGNSNGVPAHEEMCQHMMKQHVAQQNNIGTTASQREIQLQQFLNRPPPEYKHHTVTNQVLSPHQQMMTDNSMVILNPTQTAHQFSQPSDVSRRGMVSESIVHTLQHPSSQNQMPVRTRTQQACVPTPHVGMGSALSNFSQTTGSSTHPNITSANLAGHMSRTRSVYSSCLPRSQRPPNVNVGPEGLNISQRAAAPEWRQLLLQQQQQQQSGARQISQLSPRMQFPRAPIGTIGQNILSPSMNMPSHQIISRTVVPQQAMRGETTQRHHLQNNQILMHPQQQQMAFHTGMDPMDSTNGQPNTMLMTTLASSTNNLTNQRNIYPTTGSANQSNQVDDPTHFNLDFLDNNFIEGTDSDLLNIDPVLNGGTTSFSLLDEMSMLNK